MTPEYLTQQLMTVAPFSTIGNQNGQFKVKLVSERGETKWMNINNQQFRAIEEALEYNL